MNCQKCNAKGTTPMPRRPLTADRGQGDAPATGFIAEQFTELVSGLNLENKEQPGTQRRV